MNALVEALSVIDPETVALGPVLEELRQTLRAHNCIAYSPMPAQTRWAFDHLEWVGPDSEEREARLRAFVQSFPSNDAGFAAYDPFAVQSEQRNRALTVDALAQVEATAQSRHARLHVAVGTGGEDQLRVLVCHGPRLLMWVGAMREEPFGMEDARALQSVVEPLRRRLVVTRQLERGHVWHAALEALLDRMMEPALLLTTSGRVELANAAAAALVDDPRRRGELRALREAIVAGVPPAAFHTIDLKMRGCPGYVLAIADAKVTQVAAKLARARVAWNLDSRGAFVLEELALGRSNKEIASTLGCAEVTVERHVSRLFRASGTRSRTELVRALFTL